MRELRCVQFDDGRVRISLFTANGFIGQTFITTVGRWNRFIWKWITQRNNKMGTLEVFILLDKVCRYFIDIVSENPKTVEKIPFTDKEILSLKLDVNDDLMEKNQQGIEVKKNNKVNLWSPMKLEAKKIFKVLSIDKRNRLSLNTKKMETVCLR
jgi:hypothetical protein